MVHAKACANQIWTRKLGCRPKRLVVQSVSWMVTHTGTCQVYMMDVCQMYATWLLWYWSWTYQNTAGFCSSTLSRLKSISRSIIKLQSPNRFSRWRHLVFPNGTNFQINLAWVLSYHPVLPLCVDHTQVRFFQKMGLVLPKMTLIYRSTLLPPYFYLANGKNEVIIHGMMILWW